VLAAALRLSPALARLAAAFAQGESLKDYAARHGVSYETVRTQMKQLMDAVGVNRQALLMRTLITLSGIRTPV
jgi:DNA-binding CsgD family transcriptional regulator